VSEEIAEYERAKMYARYHPNAGLLQLSSDDCTSDTDGKRSEAKVSRFVWGEGWGNTPDAGREGAPCPYSIHASYNGAKRVVELQFSTSIPRAQLRPGYGAGFQGAPLACSSPPPHPDPLAQEQDCDPSKTAQTPDPHDPANL